MTSCKKSDDGEGGKSSVAKTVKNQEFENSRIIGDNVPSKGGDISHYSYRFNLILNSDKDFQKFKVIDEEDAKHVVAYFYMKGSISGLAVPWVACGEKFRKLEKMFYNACDLLNLKKFGVFWGKVQVLQALTKNENGDVYSKKIQLLENEFYENSWK